MLTTKVSADVQALASAHLGLVHVLASQTRRRLPRQFTLEDLKGVGAIGLMDAARRYNPALGIPFVPFARKRIVGAMLDYIRAQDPATRAHRRDINAGAPDVRDVQLAWTSDGSPASHVSARLTPADEQAARLELEEIVRVAILSLPPLLQRVIVEHDYSDHTLQRVGAGLGLSKSRAFQLRQEALAQLRVILHRRGLTAECLCN